MVPEAALRTYLTTKTAITDLVGSRIYVGVIPQTNSTYPVLVYNLISSVHEHWKTSGAGMVQCRFQLDAYSTDYSDVADVAEACRESLQMYSGLMGDLEVTSVILDGEFSLYEPPVDSSDVGTHRKSQDWLIRFYISIPTP